MNNPKRTNVKFKKPRALYRPSDPLLVDRMVDVASAIFWGIYALWGLSASILGIATISKAISPGYNFLWSGAIGTFSAIACLGAISLFFDLGSKYNPLFKKRVELWAVRSLLCVIFVYPVLLFVTAFASDDPNRFPTAVLALSYLVFPTLRAYILKKRIEAFERAQKEYLPNGTE